MSIYVLIHGGGHGGWCYRDVANRLRVKGHDVYAPTLTGVGDRHHAIHAGVDLETHIADVANLLSFEDLRQVILVGHSYAGMVITGAADRELERVSHLVYLDAAIPLNGEALIDTSPGLAALATDNRIVNGVELGLYPNAKAIAIYGLADSPLAEWAIQRLTPHPWKAFTQPLRLTREAQVMAIPRTLINCTSTLKLRDPANIHRWLNGERVWEIDTGHDLMLLEPQAVTDMLLKLAA
jgi:pimeloyl-ACP methyl ester carboxylesterase